MAALNHPEKGDTIKVEPIRTVKDVKAIKRLLADKERDLALFTLGINTNLRASDLLRITVGMVRNLQPGDHFALKEKKTGKDRNISINRTVHAAITALLYVLPDAKDNDLLFQSRKVTQRKPVLKDGKEVRQPAKGEISVPTLNGLVKLWCKEINLTGNYGSHTLRKTFGYMHRTINKTDLPTLMQMFNHSSQKQTLDYLCIQPEEIKNAYMFEL
ncbi:MAG: tyrosine-type recombinase/integrase [Pelobacteraceae bacterium]